MHQNWKTVGWTFGATAAVAAAAITFAKRSRRGPDDGSNGLSFPVPDELYPFQHRFVDLPGGIHMHYIDEGPPQPDAPTILLLHGNPTWSFLYRNIILGLRSTFRCVAPDYPNFGLSTAPAHRVYRPAEQSRILEAFCQRLGLRQTIMMVHDWGGPIGLGLAGRQPELVKGLVIANTWAWPADGDRDKIRFSSFFGGPFGRFLGINFNAIVRIFLRLGTQRSLSDAEMDCYLRPFHDRNRRAATAAFPREIVASGEYMREVLAGLGRIANLPALIVWGAADISSSLADKDRFEVLFPNHSTLILDGARHFVQEDAPAEICAAIRRFVLSSDSEKNDLSAAQILLKV
jgi:haloalkane dehalogenase